MKKRLDKEKDMPRKKKKTGEKRKKTGQIKKKNGLDTGKELVEKVYFASCKHFPGLNAPLYHLFTNIDIIQD